VVLVALFHSRYDAFGNLTADSQSGVSTTYYSYNALDELTLITPPSGPSASFTRDALGRLRDRTLSTTPVNTLDTYGYVGTSETVFEIATTGGSTSTTRGAIGVDGSRLAVRTAAVSFTLPDLHGSIAGLFALTPTSLSDAYRYDGYGVTVATAGSTPNAWRYRSNLDIAQGTSAPTLYEMGARYYAPGLGAFTSLDTVAGTALNPLSLNRFLYAEANPATLIDPSGHFVPQDDDSRFLGDNPNNVPSSTTPPKPPAKDHRNKYTCQYNSCTSADGSSRAGNANAPFNPFFDPTDVGPATGACATEVACRSDVDDFLTSFANAFGPSAALSFVVVGGITLVCTVASGGACLVVAGGAGLLTVATTVSGDTPTQAELDAMAAHRMTPADVGTSLGSLTGGFVGGLVGGAGVSWTLTRAPTLLEVTGARTGVGSGLTSSELRSLGAASANDPAVFGAVRKYGADLAHPVPPYMGHGTSGTLVLPAGSEVPLVSGWKGPAASLPRTEGLNIVTKSHVEGHAAAVMRSDKIREATLWINRSPCPGPRGCSTLLPRMVPDGSTLTIYVVPNGSAGQITQTIVVQGIGQ
jgi:RHS repeat-associated protein